MSFYDDFVYATILVISIPLGLLISPIRSPLHRKLFCCFAGLICITVVCRIHVLHSLFTCFVNCLILMFVSPRKCHIISFVWCFGYIVFFRNTIYFGLPAVDPHANAVQLLLTLKMVGLAFEVHDSHGMTQKLAEATGDDKESVALEWKFRSVSPGLVDIFCYSFCYIGLLTGPFYKYRTFEDMMTQGKSEKQKVNAIAHVKKRLFPSIPIVVAVYFAVSHFFSLEYVDTEEFDNCALWFRVFYMVPTFVTFRMRLYFAWLLSEAMCMTALLGCYPSDSIPKCGQGPTDLKKFNHISLSSADVHYDFETIRNIDIYGCELAPTCREGMRSWNRTVQYWLASYVYRRFPSKSSRTTVTMLVSAFWHGVYPGYYLSFMTVPPTLFAEDIMIKTFRTKTDSFHQQLFDVFWTFWKMRFFDYMCMGFLLLTWDRTLHYWGSIYFLGHFLIAAFILLAYLRKTAALIIKSEKIS